MASIAFIGFGEAGQALAEGFRGEGAASIAAWDILFPDAKRGAQAGPGLSGRQFYVDINSVSPNRKRRAAEIVGGRARFVGMAVMARVHPLRHKTPALVSGPAAGDAAAIKMVRSLMIKGLSALTQECFLAARR